MEDFHGEVPASHGGISFEDVRSSDLGVSWTGGVDKGFMGKNGLNTSHQQVVESLLLLMIGTCPGQGVERRYNFLVRALRGDYNGLVRARKRL